MLSFLLLVHLLDNSSCWMQPLQEGEHPLQELGTSSIPSLCRRRNIPASAGVGNIPSLCSRRNILNPQPLQEGGHPQPLPAQLSSPTLPGLQQQVHSTKGSWEASQDDQSRSGSPPPLSRTIHDRFHPFARVFLLCAKLLQNYFVLN